MQQIDLKLPDNFAYLLFLALKWQHSSKGKTLCPYDTSWISLQHAHHVTLTFKKFGVYQALVINGPPRESLDDVDNWAFDVDSYRPVRYDHRSSCNTKWYIYITSLTVALLYVKPESFHDLID